MMSERFECDVSQSIDAGRLRGVQKDDRDLLVYFLWQSGRLTNGRIGRLFGLSYSAVSHAVRKLKARLTANPELKKKFEQLYSQVRL